MLKYRPFEMHCHTRHSDGTFLVPQLIESVAAYGYAGLALTDHNAVTGLLEVTEELQRKNNCLVLPGIEWTTFYGHLLVIGCDRFVDWRFVTPDTIDEALQEIRAAGGIAGVAHPCEVGSPLMCGCNWEFRVKRWDLMDYVEIWSGPDPHASAKNGLAMPWYDALLNQGYHLAISAGRDWHGPDKPGQIPLLTATYLGIDGDVTIENAKAAIRAGRTYVTTGPTVDVTLKQENRIYTLGQTAHPGPASVSVRIGMEERSSVWAHNEITPQSIRLVHNGKILAEQPYNGKPVDFSVSLVPGWLRVEVYGTALDRPADSIALTSPIYSADLRDE